MKKWNYFKAAPSLIPYCPKLPRPPVQPAEADRTFTEKQTTLKLSAGSDSKLCSFSR
jgi:hypothetical protein